VDAEFLTDLIQGFHSVNGLKGHLGLEVAAEAVAFPFGHLLAPLLSKLPT